MRKNIIILTLILIAACTLAQAPDWQWATLAGDDGWGSDYGNAIDIDDNGNSYLTGSFCYTSTFGSYSVVSNGSEDVFVAKLDASGNWLWVVQAGGIGGDEGRSIVLDDFGNIYITGWFKYTATFGSYSLTANGGDRDIFVAKLDSTGNWLWAIQAGGIDGDIGRAITSDDVGNCYITGRYNELATFGPYTLTSTTNSTLFIVKIDSDGNWLWATQANGINNNDGRAIEIDDFGNVFVTGYYSGNIFFGDYSLSCNEYYSEIYVAKLNAEGQWMWATQAGGNGNDYPQGISIDDNFNCYVTGKFSDIAFFGDIALNCGSGVGYNLFVAKLDADGNWLWASQTDAQYNNEAMEIAIDNEGNNYITGNFFGTTSFGNFTITYSGGYYDDIFVAKIDADGSWLWATKAGGDHIDNGIGIEIDNIGNSYVTGSFRGVATFGSYIIYGSQDHDIFVAKLGNVVSTENIINQKDTVISNHPNPFNPSTTINFSINNNSEIELSIYNINGQKIKTVTQNDFSKGIYSVIWNGDDESNKPVSSGIYFCKLNVNGKTIAVRKCLLLK